MARIITSVAGLVGTAWINGQFFEDGGFRIGRLNAETGEKTYSDLPLPTAFRTQADVRSTAEALGLQTRAGRTSAARLGDAHSVAWKSREANNVGSLEGLVNNPHPTLTLTKAQYKKILAYYKVG